MDFQKRLKCTPNTWWKHCRMIGETHYHRYPYSIICTKGGSSSKQPIMLPPTLTKMEKEILLQYTDLVKEEKEIKHRIVQLEKEIEKLEQKVNAISDVVKGGNGGDERYKVEGYTQEIQRMRTDLMVKKMLMSQRQALLTTLGFEILEKTNDVESFIASIDNSYMRRLVSFRVVDGLKWEEVAVKMGGNNTEDSVKKAFYRFLK